MTAYPDIMKANDLYELPVITTAEQAYDLLGDGVMWVDDNGYMMRSGKTQDTIPVPKEIATEMMPRLTSYNRFGQNRWYRTDALWIGVYKEMGKLKHG